MALCLVERRVGVVGAGGKDLGDSTSILGVVICLGDPVGVFVRSITIRSGDLDLDFDFGFAAGKSVVAFPVPPRPAPLTNAILV